ncbi:alpha/beta fold hydrolase [Micromonospora sp. NPDC048930]|uniref:alpha/beta fold hydrolase n=1 Tax=Micromonospora sp. NPDC048930 TaxID=3364261 RepID=UPI003717B46E
MYGRWDDAARAHAAADTAQRSLPVSQACNAGYQPDVVALHARLARLAAPVLLLAGERDLWPTAELVRQAAGRFADVTVTVLPGAGHHPWLDDPSAFRTAVDTFLACPPR